MRLKPTYPFIAIPNKILESKRCFIPNNVHPVKPQDPALLKIRYIGHISLVTMILAVCIYKFSDIPSITWVTATLTVLLVLSAIFAIYENISNRLASMQNAQKQESYDSQLQQYLDDISEVEEIKKKNANPELLSDYRKQRLKHLLLYTNISLKPVSGIGPKYFDCFYKVLIDNFPGKVLINYGLEEKNGDKFLPNYVVAISDWKLYFDIEIDSPYSLDNRLPKAYVTINADGSQNFTFDKHNNFFNAQGWVVIRFAEEQVINSPKSCCKAIAEVINNIIEDKTILSKFDDIPSLIPIKVWSTEQCQRLSREQYRESYLPPKPKNKDEDEFLRNRNVLKIVETEEKDEIFFDNFIQSTKIDEKEEIESIEKQEIKEQIAEIPTIESRPETPIIPIKTEQKIEIVTNLSSKKMENSSENNFNKQSEQPKIQKAEISQPEIQQPNRVNFGSQKENITLPLYMNIAKDEDVSLIKVQTLSINDDQITVPESSDENLDTASENSVSETATENEEATETAKTNDASAEISSSEKQENDNELTAAEANTSESDQEISESSKTGIVAEKPQPIVPEKEIIEPDYSTKEAYDRKKMVELVAKMTENYKLENWKNLLEICNQIIEIDQHFELAYMRRSTALGNLGKLEDAIEDCKMVTKLNPENADAYYNAGVANLLLKNFQSAINDFKKAVEFGISNTSEIYLTIANIYNKLSDDANYKEYLQKSASQDNASAKILLNKIKQNENYSSQSEFKGFVTKHLEIAREGISQIAFSVNDDYCAIADQSRKLKVYRTSNWEVAFKEDVQVSAMAFSRNNKYMAIGGHGLLRVLNITNSTFSLFSDVTNFTGSIKKMFFHPFNNETLFVSDNFSLWKVDIKTRVINKAISDFQLMATSRDLQYIAGKDYFNNIKIYKINSWTEIFKLKVDPTVQIKTLALSQDCTRLIFGDNDGNIHVYNPLQSVSVTVSDLKAEISQIEMSSNNFYAVLTNDRKLRFFNTSTAQKGREIQLKFLPKLMQISNINNYMVIGNLNEDVDILYVNESVTETEPVTTSQTA